MKKIIRASLYLLLFGVFSCNDATDIVQESELNEEAAFQTVGDLQTGLSGVYGAYRPDAGGNGDGDIILLNDLFTDNIKRGESNQGQGAQEYNFLINTNTSFAASVWSSRYTVINRANRVLAATERLLPTFSPAEEAAALKIKAQLLAFRALCHLDLFEYYTTDYDNASALSIIIMDRVPDIEDQLERNTVAEVTAFIEADLVEAANLIGDTNSGVVTFINADVIKAIHARFALESGNYTLAESLANDFILDGNGNSRLTTGAAYEQMFQRSLGAGTQGELIFSLIRRPADSDIAQNYYFNSVSLEGNPFFEASLQLYESYGTGDIRRDAFITPDVDDVLLITKYKGTANTPLANDAPVFRISEMLLIRAEAEARRGALAAAAASIQLLRTARYASNLPDEPVFANLNQALETILLERRREFAFEGHRYLDLKRLGGELNIGVSRLQSDADSFAAPKDLLANDYRFTLPIPQAELNGNNNITQNPGYSN